MLDVIIRGGDVVDGTGRPRRRADVGVHDGRIVEIGEVAGDAAAGHRRHRPGRDPGLRRRAHPLRRAGVLGHGADAVAAARRDDVLAGNCGFTIAPLSNDPADGEYLMRMLARVEGMPLESLREGVPW